MKWNLKEGAKEFGIHHETLRKRLIAEGHSPKLGSKWTTLEIANAINGSLVKERTRLTKAEADTKETELAVIRGELVTMDVARQILAETLIPLRSHLMALPATISAQVNPSDPVAAQRILQIEIERILRGDEGSKPKPKGRAKR